MTDNYNAEDVRIKRLIELVETKKEEIKNAKKPVWLTNGSFKTSKDEEEYFNVRTVTEDFKLTTGLALLISREESHNKANKELGLNSEFKWFGHTIEEWKNDFKSRVAQKNVKKDMVELKEVEKELDDLKSPELKKQNKLDNIAKKLA